MKITENKVVTIDYTLKDDSGNVLDSSEGGKPFSFIQGIGNIIPGLEKAMTGKAVGDKFNVSILPAEAYGEYDEKMIFDVTKDKFPEPDKLEIGMQFQTSTENGMQVLSVIGLEGEQVKLDANHPLAGKTLHFDVKVNDVRDATKEELDHGHAH